MLANPLSTADPMRPVECSVKVQRSRTKTKPNIEVGHVDETVANCFIPAERRQLIRQHSSISDRSQASTRSSHSDDDNDCHAYVEAASNATAPISAIANTSEEQQICTSSSSSSELANAGDTDKDDHRAQSDGSHLGAQPSRLSASPDHTETVQVHPEQQPEATHARDTSARKRSRLRTAGRAILLFKRATSTSSSASKTDASTSKGAGSSGLERPGAFSYPRSLVATFWRQNTADNSTCTQSSRRNSFASQSGSGRNAPPTSTSNFSLPRFIVPKMNALKLPIVCLIKSVDGKLMREVFVHRYELGQYLIDSLNVSLGMVDAKYFGLKLARSIDEQEDVAQPWLDLNESVYKQISKHSKLVTLAAGGGGGGGDGGTCLEPESDQRQDQQRPPTTAKSVDLYLRVKFYPPNLARIQEQFLREYLWLQLRRDLRLGKLVSSKNNLSYLMACVLQYELGDYMPELVTGKLCELNILPNQDLIEQQAIETWRTRLPGTKRHQSQMQFLRASVILETYGFDYYPVRDHQRQQAYLLGFNYAGIKTIRNNRIMHHFRWNSLSKISYERRMIIFHTYPSENSKRKQILGFKCLSNEDCQNLYMRLLEQKYFFTVDLTYFDRSLRNPAPLAESSLDEQERSHCDRWPPQFADSRQECEGVGREFGADTAGGRADERRESSGALRSGRPDSCHSLGSDRLGRYELIEERGRDEASHTRTRHQETSVLTGVQQPIVCNTHDCMGCTRVASRLRQAQHSNNQSLDSASSSGHQTIGTGQLLKSVSLQEASLTRSCTTASPALAMHTTPNCCASPGAKLSFQLDRPDSAALARPHHHGDLQTSALSVSECREYDELLVDECPGGDGFTAGPGRSRFAQPVLERQCSVLNYSPECENEPRDMGWRDRNMQGLDEVRHDAAGHRFAPNRSASPSDRTRSEPADDRSRTPDKQTFGRRVANLAEQILTHPARLFDSTATTTTTTPPFRRLDPCHEHQAPTVANSARAHGMQGNLFVQALVLGVFIVVVNLVFRLSDAISGAVIYLLTFKSTDGDQTGQQPVACSPLWASLGGGQ